MRNSESSFVENLGKNTLEHIHYVNEVLLLAFTSIKYAFSFNYYKNNAVRAVVAKQVFFTAWQILPQFTVASGLLSYILISIVIATTISYGLSEYAIELALRILVFELLPIMAALFVALRSGAAINTEIALMTVNNEFSGLEQTGTDPEKLELIPRVIGGVISVLSISAISTFVALFISYISTYGFEFWAIPEFSNIITKVFTPISVLTLWIKLIIFGFMVTIIPIITGKLSIRSMSYVPVSVLQGMVRLFFTIMSVEVVSLAIYYI